MDGKTPRGPTRSVLAAKEKANGKDVENSRPAQRKSKAVDRIQLPILVAGKEVLGRELSVFKNSNKNPVWIKGAVKEFDEPSVCHKIQYKQPLPECAGEEWLCLGKSMFMWTNEDFICPFANPTYSARYTPRKEDAVGQRVKVFWTAMGKWYQGKVIEYDAGSGKHRVYFKDGDEKRCLLRQEALVWLDIPQLCSDTAIRVMRQEEGEPLPLAAIREEEGEDGGAQGSSSSLQQQIMEKGKSGGKAVTNGKRQARGAAKDQSDATSQDRKRRADQPKSAGKDPGRSGRFSKAISEAHTAASGSREAPTTSTGAETNARRANGHEGDDSKSASSSSHEPEEGKDAAGKASRKLAPSKGAFSTDQNAGGSKAPDGSQATEEASRKRSRLGLPVLAVSQQPPSKLEPKRRAANPAAKIVRKVKKAAEDSRLGGRRQKTAADVHFEEACQAVLGSRVGVWWEDDRCYYKGQVVAHDWYHKRLKVLYDDGVEEFIMPHKKETQFTWLTPRAQTAGATDTVHAAFKLLQAVNAGSDVAAAAPELEAGPGVGAPPTGACTPAMASVQTVSHTADGSHLDALVPLRPSSAASGKGEEGARGGPQPNGPVNGMSLPQPVDSTTRALPSQGKNGGLLGVSTPAAWPAPLRGLAGTPATARSSLGLTGLQAMVPPSSLPQTVPAAALLHHRLLAPSGMPTVAPSLLPQQHLPAGRPAVAERRFVMTPEAGARAPNKLFTQSAPAGQSAEGWKISLVFRGNNQIFQGRVLTFDPKQGRHHVLWDDGEDEWVDVTREPLTWHADRLKTTGFSAGLSSGQPVPKGEEMIGWRIAVYWKEEQHFYEGTVEDYDSELDQHTVSYVDGDELCESLCGQIFKFVLPPTVQVVGSRRTSTRKRTECSDPDDAPRRMRRRHRSNDDDDDDDYVDDDSDGEWGRHVVVDRKPTVRQLSQLQREVSTPVVTTPRTCDIRRLNSKVGSLLVYEGEENHLDLVASGNSPKLTPLASQLPELQSVEPDPRGRPIIDRRISGLKSAQGFRLPVRRVRVYLPGGASGNTEDVRSEGAADGERCGSLADRSGSVPGQHTLKQMLRRVDSAQQSMQKGVPAGSLMVFRASRAAVLGEAQDAAGSPGSSDAAADAGPAEAPASFALTTGAADEKEDQTVAEAPESPTQQNEHMTPPSSPFAPYAAECAGSFPEASDEMQLEEAAVVPSKKCCDVQNSRAVPVLVNGSLSLPQTPSAISEGHVGPSRNGSIISGPMLAELAQSKAVAQAAGTPKPDDVEHVLG